MTDLYPEIRWLHIVAVIMSGSLFTLRGLVLNAGGGGWAMAAPLRYLSYGIDTLLLAAAVMLMAITQQYPGGQDWLSVKVALLVVYIALGSFALKRGRTRSTRLVCFTLALLVFGFIIGIARTQDPLGVLSPFIS
ncbi:SirB2 family protein [Dongia sp.]|uniref:SirB2 family protein n=1 Tax=Dongia sp. TaxID=1977262 RepID=UPI0035B3DC32